MERMATYALATSDAIPEAPMQRRANVLEVVSFMSPEIWRHATDALLRDN